MYCGHRLSDLDTETRRLIQSGLAPSTRRAYRRAAADFRRFCAEHELRPLPAAEQTVLRYVTHLSLQGASHTTAVAHLAGVRHLHIVKGRPWTGRTERVRLALRAIAKKPRSTPAPRLPLTVALLLKLRRRLRRGPLSTHDRRAAWAAITIGFFGALRGSEYLAPGSSVCFRRRTCLRRHITTSNECLTPVFATGSPNPSPAQPGPVYPKPSPGPARTNP